MGMRIEFLGTGGAGTTPRPLCSCRICVEARDKGVPYSRTGPSVFVHGPDLLIDTPEEIKTQLNRSQVTRIAGVTYSHWHPDHTTGRRVLEEMNIDWRAWPRAPRSTTDVFLPAQVAADFREQLGTWDQLEYMQNALGTVAIHELGDGEDFRLGETLVTPFRLAEEFVYAFLLQEGNRRALIAPDELHGWSPGDGAKGVDVAVLPMGIVEFHPLSGERMIHEDHWMLQLEATFDETLDIVRQLNAERVYFTHIEEMDQLSYDDLAEVAARLQHDGLPVEFAFDTLVVEV
jgi:phosphoribosyl 1,2-cyclic phosphate phosphodiesterase